ncbi:uncharacterized protein BCR38DRAFT_29372 [Pseudomassariella vexata]|uniref:Ubiquinol-cytochrome C reductase hinge domain-containing protein n=1 Tax=Pseudomassariella vexata TaxID=1141098 RepID=A0A1Y2DRA3_9PEZI|nr:uncharacterized protein BCR38DRAFT_29372 [Pseudomassariella vexata]ORY61205.1 hypothetical protein BCR38DRAFT_29372 [Pseudomassariella vexata]
MAQLTRRIDQARFNFSATTSERPSITTHPLNPPTTSHWTTAASALTAMGIWDTITDLVEAATPWTTAEAEAPQPEEQESNDEPAEEEEGGEDEEEEEEEDDEEEIVDPKEKFEEECKESKQCAPAKHHFDECVERVTQQEEDGGAKEDCVEECCSSLPPCPLRHPMCRSQALVGPQINDVDEQPILRLPAHHMDIYGL